MRKIDSSDASFGSIRELATDINAYLSDKHTLQEGIGKSDDIFLCHFIRHFYVHNPAFNRYRSRVLIQPIDGTVIEPHHVKDLNQFDLIITPAKVGKDIMEQCGVKSRIEVVPNYFEDGDVLGVDRLKYRNVLPNLDDKFLFYHESSLTVRKNVRALVESYLLAFSDTANANKVHLLIKGFGEAGFEEAKHIILSSQKKYQSPAKVSLIDSDFSKSLLRRIWSTIDCYVSFAHMEGFGIPLLRMAANSKPIVTLRSEISGYMDFLDDSDTYFVESVKCPLADEARLIFDPAKSHWEDVESISQASPVLAQVYRDYLRGSMLFNKKPLLEFRKKAVMERYNFLVSDLK